MPRVRLQADANPAVPLGSPSAAAPGPNPDHAPASDTRPLDAEPLPGADASMIEAFLRLPEAVVIVDGNGTIVWGNPSAERIFERTLETWVGQSALDLVHPDDLEFALRSLSTG